MWRSAARVPFLQPDLPSRKDPPLQKIMKSPPERIPIPPKILGINIAGVFHAEIAGTSKAVNIPSPVNIIKNITSGSSQSQFIFLLNPTFFISFNCKV